MSTATSAMRFNPVERWPDCVVPHTGAGLRGGRFYGYVETVHGTVWIEAGDYIVKDEHGGWHVVDEAVARSFGWLESRS